MANKVMVNVPLNRVEGDLEIKVEVNKGVVTDAWSSGTLYRGFEKLLLGRGLLDGLVITPRICGICSTGHLIAASRALDMIAQAQIPPDAVRVRNIALMTEQLQSDMRHTFLMFTADFANPAYQQSPLFEEVLRRYEPFKGETVLEVVRETKKVLEILAILGGQWPHSSYSVPGGVTSIPSTSDLLQCRHLLKRFKTWYEKRILGCKLERWLAVKSSTDLEVWLAESEVHRQSDLGFFIRFAREIGLDNLGQGHGNFISYGNLPLPPDTKVRGRLAGEHLIPAGFTRGTQVARFEQTKIAEHVAHSWYVDYDGGRHPFEGETHALTKFDQTSDKYTWAKAPRYDGSPAETGSLAEMIISGQPLFTDLVDQTGPNVFLRELARIVRSAEVIPAIETWLTEIQGDGVFYQSPGEITVGEGYGLVHATRGALGHWVKIARGKIEHYQIITPTSWHASPRDSGGVRGPWEEALINTRLKDISNPVELGHVVRSFDACLVCTVHAVSRGRSLSRKTLS